MAENICPHCGKPVPETALEGICPECMLKAGLASQTEAGDAGPHGTKTISPPSHPSEIAPLFPHLEILECLGRGGMGAVYRARQPKLNRIVALKILARDRENDPKFAERFTREAQALARMNHQNIVTVYDFGEADGHCYLLMEYVDGLNLRQLMHGGKLSAEQALKIVPSICEALQFAHEQGIVHRDIKPENILLDKAGRVKIADFGIAKILGGDCERKNLTAEQQVIGTPHYMAPEQVEKPATVDHRADIFSLGVVFYEMLTGELPLGKFQPPSRKVQVDVRLDEVVLHALEKEPDRRYQHASEVKTDVETITAGPLTSGPDSGKSGNPDLRTKVGGAVGASAFLFGVLAVAVWLGWLASDKSFSLPASLAAVAVVTVVVIGFGAWLMANLGKAIGPKTHVSFAPKAKRRSAEDQKRSLWITAARWTARISGTLLLLFYGTFVIAEGLPPIASQPEGVQLNFIALGLMLGGFIVGWKRDGTAALLIASGWTLWQVSEGSVRWNLFQTPIPVAALYAFCWWAARPRRTVPLVTSTAALATALALGLLFVPTNIFVRGHIVDAVSGAPLRDVELRLPPRAGQSPGAAPNARSDQNGGYRLYVGWYLPAKQLTLAAPGYLTLVTNLGRRELGQRNIGRDFALRPIASPGAGDRPSTVTAPPVVVETFPVSGASDVDPAITELRATFSKPMRGAAWCRTDEFAMPEVTGPPRYLDDRTCVLPVRLQPGRVYALWLNTDGELSFRDRNDHPAVPYLLVFQTRQ